MHETVNGMLLREDGLKLPVGIIPGGTGNDVSHTVGNRSVEQALQSFIKGDLLKVDLTRQLSDFESEVELRTHFQSNPEEIP